MRFRNSAVLFVLAAAFALAQSGDIPAYHHEAPAKGEKLPHVLTQQELADQGLTQPAVLAAYRSAEKAGTAFYQQPCYCHCDRAHGHESLHSCFESTHGANCGTCIQEALYTYRMSKKGWTAAQIRDGIIRGDYHAIDLQHPDPVE